MGESTHYDGNSQIRVDDIDGNNTKLEEITSKFQKNKRVGSALQRAMNGKIFKDEDGANKNFVANNY